MIEQVEYPITKESIVGLLKAHCDLAARVDVIMAVWNQVLNTGGRPEYVIGFSLPKDTWTADARAYASGCFLIYHTNTSDPDLVIGSMLVVPIALLCMSVEDIATKAREMFTLGKANEDSWDFSQYTGMFEESKDEG